MKKLSTKVERALNLTMRTWTKSATLMMVLNATYA